MPSKLQYLSDDLTSIHHMNRSMQDFFKGYSDNICKYNDKWNSYLKLNLDNHTKIASTATNFHSLNSISDVNEINDHNSTHILNDFPDFSQYTIKPSDLKHNTITTRKTLSSFLPDVTVNQDFKSESISNKISQNRNSNQNHIETDDDPFTSFTEAKKKNDQKEGSNSKNASDSGPSKDSKESSDETKDKKSESSGSNKATVTSTGLQQQQQQSSNKSSTDSKSDSSNSKKSKIISKPLPPSPFGNLPYYCEDIFLLFHPFNYMIISSVVSVYYGYYGERFGRRRYPVGQWDCCKFLTAELLAWAGPIAFFFTPFSPGYQCINGVL